MSNVNPDQTNEEKMLKVSVGNKTFRTHSLDRVAHRLYGKAAVAIVLNQDGTSIAGLFATPQRNGHGVLRLRETFRAVA